MLSKDEKEHLRGLSKEHAENTGLHMLAAYALEEDNPKAALDHAKWVARQASRVDIARETLASIAYRQGEYKLAMREFRTAFRMNGYLDYLPFIADCERGLGNPRKALDVASSDEGKQLRGEAKAEMFLVYAGALADLGLMDKAVETVATLAKAKGLSGEYRMRAVQAQQNFLEQAGKADEAAGLDDLLDALEAKYADADDDESADDIVVDHDLEEISDSDLESLGIEAEDDRRSNRRGGYDSPRERSYDARHADGESAADAGVSESAESPESAGVTESAVASGNSATSNDSQPVFSEDVSSEAEPSDAELTEKTAEPSDHRTGASTEGTESQEDAASQSEAAVSQAAEKPSESADADND
ncbi:MAG: hypothetical protein ABF489_06960 [Bifidobacterium sp.]